MNRKLPDIDVMYRAFFEKDLTYEGIFVTGVKTTRIFCRPSCTARKAKRENVEFFSTSEEALAAGYRPCRICRPFSLIGEIPGWLEPLLGEVHAEPAVRLTDRDIRSRGIDPNRVRRWFKTRHNMTFQSYLRALRISRAYERISSGGEKIIDAAFESGYESLSGFSEGFKNITGFSPGQSRRRRCPEQSPADGENKIITITRIPTPLGPVVAGAVREGICFLDFEDDEGPPFPAGTSNGRKCQDERKHGFERKLEQVRASLNARCVPGIHPDLDVLAAWIEEYFSGKRKEFNRPIVLTGTPFQKTAWQVLRTIPYGSTRSYQEQARILGNPRAVRAVARANSENRIAIIIPCHRVVGKNGALTGYAGGLWRKKFLLDLEAGIR